MTQIVSVGISAGVFYLVFTVIPAFPQSLSLPEAEKICTIEAFKRLPDILGVRVIGVNHKPPMPSAVSPNSMVVEVYVENSLGKSVYAYSCDFDKEIPKLTYLSERY